MEYVNLGSSGLKISRIVVGGAHIGETLDQAGTNALVHAAWDAGISTFYTGDDYNLGDSERLLGAALKPRRDDMVVIAKTGYRVGAYNNYSKNGGPVDGGEDYASQRLGTIDHAKLWGAGVAPTSRGMSRKHLVDALHATLKRLDTDYVDVYAPHYWDPEVPIEETMETLNSFVQQGKVRYLACSQHTSWQIYKALWTSDKYGFARYDGVQSNVSLLERGVLASDLPALRTAGVSMFAATSDAGGLLSGEYNRNSEPPTGGSARQRYIDPFWNDAAFDALEKVVALAGELGRPVGEMSEAWVLAQKPIAALFIGPDDPAEIAVRARAAENPLDASELAAVNELAATLPVSLRPARHQQTMVR